MRTVKGKITWIDVLKPNDAEIKALKSVHAFHPIILGELMRPSARARVERYENYLFLVYHLPIYDEATKTSRRAEIDILITKNTIITVHYEPFEQIDTFFESLLKDEELRKKALGSNTALPLYYLVQELISFSLREIKHIETKVERVANSMFSRNNDELLREISYIKRDILDYRLIARPQRELFNSLVEIGKDFWGKQADIYLRDLIGDNLRVVQTLENYFETIESLEETNAQMLGAETNIIIKRFTVLAFLFTIPLFFIFSLSIPYVSEHILTSPARFWTIFLSIFALVGMLAWTFKKKKLL